MTFRSPLIKRFVQVGLWVATLVWVAVAWKTFNRTRPQAQPMLQPELLPIENTVPTWDGSYPVVSISPRPSASGKLKFAGKILMQKPTTRHDAPVNEFEVALDSGMFVLRQTDLFVPDVMPLSLTRTYRPWDYHSRAFGVGGNHPYDVCPTGTRRPYTYMEFNLEEGREIYLPRVSKGTGYADAVFRHTNTSSEFYGSQIAWNGNGWTLDFKDHRRFLFPEAYNATNFAQGAAFEMDDGKGHRILLKRDAARNLDQLISPAGHTIKFKYDNAARIVEARDDAGDVRQYSYNSTGHLEAVSDGSHVLYRFEYTRLLYEAGFDPYLMTAIMDGDWRVLLRNFYRDKSRVSEQRLGNGETYKYEYELNSKYVVTRAKVALPDGHVRQFNFHDGILVK
jgi:YD repeat-containing protein